MYAIVRAGGKQYRVEKGQVLYLESLPAEAGDKVTLGEVLLVSDEAGTRVGVPTLEKAQVTGTVLEHGRGSKVRVFKFKKRKHYRRTRGHRQPYTALRIDAIQA
ncbi:MAG TPA: 50S ribosomal protein L21 [Vicinamibacteria bacterium]|nr:50S ribosomal protein L21 [Vicinamibacteria bacterium]